jgi:hypothetical protein
MLVYRFLGLALLPWLLLISSISSPSSDSDHSEHSLLVQLEAPDSDVLKAVQEVSQDQIIHGTYSYEKERVLYGAHSAESSSVFGPWREPGKAFYKEAERVLAPKFFKESGDIGTLTVRYVVQSVSPTSTSLQIDALFFDARHVKHESKGNVESSEYAAIQEHLRAIQAQQKEDQQAAQEIAAKRAELENERESAGSSVQELQKKLDDLRRRVELRVKESGTPLKSAPFRSASTIQSLPADVEVLVVILTPYWYGIETEDGHRGWVHRSQLEPLP